MDRCDHRTLPCLFAIAALALAPACLAQEAVAPSADSAEATAGTVDAPDSTEVPRSAFGKVMSLLISALQQNADAGADATRSVDATLDFQPAASTRPPARDIQVSSAFRLGPPIGHAADEPVASGID